MNDENTQAHRLATSLAITAITSHFLLKGSSGYRPLDDHLKILFECLAINASFGQQKLQRIIERLSQYYSKTNLKYVGHCYIQHCSLNKLFPLIIISIFLK